MVFLWINTVAVQEPKVAEATPRLHPFFYEADTGAKQPYKLWAPFVRIDQQSLVLLLFPSQAWRNTAMLNKSAMPKRPSKLKFQS